MDKKVYLMGGAQTDFERNWTKEGKNMVDLLKEAVEDGFNGADFSMEEMVRLNHENRVCFFVCNFIADNANSKYVLPWTRQACVKAYSRAGLTVEDLDCFETHDFFTSSKYAAISVFGITEPGKEWDSVESGLIAFGGDKPINASDGLISCAHPEGASGTRMFIYLYKQMTGKAGRYKVEGAKNAMTLNIGVCATTNYTFIVGKD